MQLALRHPDRVSSLVLMVPAGGGIWPEPAEGPPGMLIGAVYRDAVMWTVMQVAPSVIHRLVGMPPELVEALPPDQRAELDAMLTTLMPFSARRRSVLNEGKTHGVGIVYPIEHCRCRCCSSAPPTISTRRCASQSARPNGYPTRTCSNSRTAGTCWPATATRSGRAVTEFLEAPVTPPVD